jgi:phage terminase large subunit-like protein
VYDFFADGVEDYEDGKVVAINTRGSLIKTSCKDKLVAVAGVEDLIIVDTDDVLLIIPKNKIEQIKDIQAHLDQTDHKTYL